MDLHLELPGNYHYIRGLGDDGIRIGNEVFDGSVLVSPSRVCPGWPPRTMEQLEPQHLNDIFELSPEVVVLGTGAKQVFLPQLLVYEFYKRAVGIEVMTTEAACRTFNVLVTEGRIVVAALMPVNQTV